jgi:gamma-glutamyltranspeptidase/glutathione hydrolase
MREFYSPPRSVAYAENAMAATSHPHATLAALECLKAGGTAMDAAVAAAAVLAVVEPMSTGIGGDVFCLYAPQGSADIIAYNGSGRAPAKAEAAWFLENGIEKIGSESPHAVTIPGTIEAWCRLTADHGNKGMDEILAPAIHYAEKGFAIQPVIGAAWAGSVKRLMGDENARRMLLVDDAAPSSASRSWPRP